MKYIGIDYGTKRIGIAISDDNGVIAFPKKTVEAKNALDTIFDMCIKDSVEHIIMGESKDFNMKDNPVTVIAKKFGTELSEKLNIPISYQSEVLSSHQASKEMHFAMTPREQSVRGEKKSENLDAQAATIILQSFLDGQR